MAIAKKKLPIMHNAATFELEFKKEAKFLKTFNHPNVVKMICAKVDDD
jgi:serine/threonine protein kinase